MVEGLQPYEQRLSGLLAVTDSWLAQLSLDDLLDQLLERTCIALRADTATVLMVDEGSQELVARAARGIEEEVRQGVRIPFGSGFAGRVAALQQPVALERVDTTTVANPLLWQKGIQVILGVPLLSAGVTIGVIHVGRLHRLPFRSEDVELLQVIADRLAHALQARQFADERAAAALLERSLMPSALPRHHQFALAARYVPTQGRAVGGDWYDAFRLPSGELWLVTGDVAGHGLGAAVVMGRLRSALRAYALEGRPVEDVITWLDRKAQHFELGAMATVICASSEPPFSQFRVSAAGHPPPVLCSPGQDARMVEVVTDLPLGVNTHYQRSAVPIEVLPGAVLVFYTDGLIERRGEPLDAGFERLTAAVRAARPETVCQEVMSCLVGRTVPRDDIALVVFRRTADPA